ncbi:His Kinase A (phospho-acceptor) domain-containing protein [Cyclobacterium lianum]|uniref:histidine kinase n=1 Tax=Cyclobacterium lianum TaxID=388280 RepID=A0A1M7P195_9BACT|nr:ATP-binding protein [Cyclobacterium lianum]SHN09908.1 His Kinase A (phospho-acceptor) domain-containing protein [Cyclobacterium lianum]
MWEQYRKFILKTCLDPYQPSGTLSYWRDYLFVSALVFVLPLCTIAVIPGLYLSYKSAFWALMLFDGLAFFGLMLIAIVPGIPLPVRKWIFIGITYLAGIFLIYFLGNFGPGLLYLLSVSIFMLLVLPDKYAFLSFALNLASCVFFGWMIYQTDLQQNYFSSTVDLQSWIAISANLIFLSAMFSILIPKLFKGLRESLEEQKSLEKALTRQKEKLKESLADTEVKNKELEHFTYVASHDLQEPLRMVTGFLQLLEQKYTHLLDQKGKTYIKFAVDGAHRMRRLILDLLAYSRIEKTGNEHETVDFNQLLAEIKLTFEPEIKKLKAEVTGDSLPVVRGPSSFYFLLLQNLIGNALKYTKPGVPPQIHLGVEDCQREWQFHLKDNGIGIDPAYFEKIFVLFQRLHHREAYEGTGIGLAIVKKIVTNLGGSIWVASNPGDGTVFYFTLPKNDSPEEGQPLLRT